MSENSKPVLVTHQDFLEKSMAAGVLQVFDLPAVKAFAAKCEASGVDPAPHLAGLTRTYCFSGGPEPRMLFVQLPEKEDTIEKGILSDLCQGYGDARSLTVTKSGADIAAQCKALLGALQTDQGTMQAKLGELVGLIGLAPPARGAGNVNLASVKLVTRTDDYVDIATYPWRETEFYEDSQADASAHPGIVRDSLAVKADEATEVDRRPKSAEDAARRQAYNDLAWALRDNLRDQVGAQRLMAVLPAKGSYQLPLSLAMALRFTDKAGELAPAAIAPVVTIGTPVAAAEITG